MDFQDYYDEPVAVGYSTLFAAPMSYSAESYSTVVLDREGAIAVWGENRSGMFARDDVLVRQVEIPSPLQVHWEE